MKVYLAPIVFLAGCATSGFEAGEPLPGLSMVARGSDVTLGWTPSSPVVTLLRPGATVEVVAEYASASGRVTGETLASARVGADNSACFSLPGVLRNAPTGPVCLRLKLPTQRALPLRAAAPGRSTDDFRYPEWEEGVAVNARRVSFQASLSAIDQTVQREREGRRGFEQWRQERNIANAAACEQMVARSEQVDRPRSVIDASEHARASRRECVWRYRAFSEKVFGSSADRVSSDIEGTFARGLSVERSSGNSPLIAQYERRIRQAQSMRAALATHTAETNAPFRPLLDDLELRLTSTATEEYRRTRSVTPGIAAAVLDSFDSCLRDSESQFALSLRTWTRQQDPSLQTGRNEALRSECRARFTEDAARATLVADAQARQSQLSAELARLPATPRAELPAQRSLIGRSCAASGG